LEAATKEKIAIGICAVSVLAAVAAIRAKLWHKNFREIFAIARRGGLRDGRVASVISCGANVLFVMFFVALYETWGQ
jgi:hypothetical protein